MTPRAPTTKGGRRCLAVGYDRTDSARRAVSWAVNELLPDGRLVIVHAGRPLHAPPSPLSTQHERAMLGQAMIDELLLSGDGSVRELEVVSEILDTDPLNALIDAAERNGAEAIVIGAKPHSRLHKALGVLTGELLGSSPLPVIAIPEGVNVPEQGRGAPPRRARSR